MLRCSSLATAEADDTSFRNAAARSRTLSSSSPEARPSSACRSRSRWSRKAAFLTSPSTNRVSGCRAAARAAGAWPPRRHWGRGHRLALRPTWPGRRSGWQRSPGDRSPASRTRPGTSTAVDSPAPAVLGHSKRGPGPCPGGGAGRRRFNELVCQQRVEHAHFVHYHEVSWEWSVRAVPGLPTRS